MRIRRLPFFIRLALLAGFPACASACLPEEFPGQLRGEQRVTVESGEPKLLLVRQHARDVKILLEGPEPLWLNGPGGRNGIDFVFLETAHEQEERTLCFYSVFDNAAQGGYALEELSFAGADAGTLALLRLFNEAGAAFLRNTAAGVDFAADAYARIAAADGAVWAHPDLVVLPRFYSALALIESGRYEQAATELAMLLDAPYDAHPAHHRVLLQAGRTELRLGRTVEAIRLLEQAWTVAARNAAMPGTRYDSARIANLLGEAHITAGAYGEGRRWLDTALEAAGGDFEILALIFNNFGFLGIRESSVPGLDRSARLALLNQSTDDHLRAAYFATQARDRSFEQIVENNLAVQYARVGERRKSLIHFFNVLRLLEEAPNPEAESFLYANLSTYTRVLGDYRKSLAYLEKSIALAQSAGTLSADLSCRHGTLLREITDLAAARAAHEVCLAQAEAEANPVSLFDALLQLGIDAIETSEPAQAEQFLARAEEVIGQVPERERESRNFSQELLLRQAQARLMLSRLPEAKAAIDAALAPELDARYANVRIEALGVAMRISEALGLREEALAHGRNAMAIIESLHADLEAERLGPAWSDQTHEVYSLLAEIHLQQYLEQQDPRQLELALLTSERSRDISLRQRLASALPNDSAGLETRKQIELYSSVASLLAASGRDAPAPGNLDYYHQHDLLSLARLNGVDSVPVPAPFELAQVQARLQPQQLVLYYLMTDAGLYVLALGSDSVGVKRVEIAGEMATFLAEADSLLRSPKDFSFARFQALAGKLLPDLAQYPQATELLIVGDGPLHALPFAALPVPGVTGDYSPLVEHYSLVSVPSLSAYFMDKPARHVDYDTDVAIIADPVFENLQLATLDADTGASGTIRGWSDTLQPLPYTAQEARDIEALIAGRTVAYTGNRATRAKLGSEEVRNARILHIATHGYFRSTSEDNIGLALSTIDEQGQRDPGFITLTELFGYAFNNELVVISGCDTAMGREQAGVGLNSLARGFLAQGVKHVISTLWPVSDRASAEFMNHFYRHLQQEKNVASALRMAQNDLSRNPDYRNPYYWAGYTLTTTSPDATIALPD